MNRLKTEKSPYLLQHADNPVDWFPWGPEAFDEARRTDRPVFLSVGYSTCHWCHVMARESFRDEAVAAALNRDFIAVKVDREERPDVDGVYMEACVAISGSGGWPLTVLLTPAGEPFWAGTYLPREQLLRLLDEAAGMWQTQRAAVLDIGKTLTERLRAAAEPGPGEPRRALAERAAASFVRRLDRDWGGFGWAPKFPMAHNLLFLLRYAQRTGDTGAREAAELTLERMARGGIFDQVGGGFARYATDARWLVPHFEKMLYDNALLALAYTEAWQMTGRAFYRRVACRTLDYILAELTDPRGGFFCGQDADSGGREGGYYVFTLDELARLLGADAPRFCRRFGVTRAGNFAEGETVLSLLDAPDWEAEDAGMDALLGRVYAYRKERAALHRDDKVLTAWNGLAIAALARAGLVFGEGRYLAAAQRAADFLTESLTGADGRLLARWRAGEAAHPGKLEDYAFYAWGLLELYDAVFRTELLERAVQAADVLLEQFFDREQGGFYPYAADGEQLLTRKKDSADGALPSGNGAAGLVLSRLSRLTGEERFRAAAEKQLRFLAGAAEAAPTGHSLTLLTLLETQWPGGELVAAAAETPAELTAFLREKPRIGVSVLVKTRENEKRLAAAAPFTASYPVPETGAAYYWCREGRCERPAASLADVDAP